ncbi:MAG: hypothetical protein U1F50_18260 [Rubrivivax sp.]
MPFRIRFDPFCAAAPAPGHRAAGRFCARSNGRHRALAALLAAAALAAFAQSPPPADGARALREREAALAPRLAANEFGQPLVIESDESEDTMRGDVYARVAQPYDTLATELVRAGAWCEVLILHLNVKHCETGPKGLAVWLGRKFEQPLEQAHRLEFSDFQAAAGADYLRVRMSAPKGPMATRDYRIEFEAVPGEGGRSFVHLRYALSAGVMGRLAMQAYLGTFGSSKVGFSAEPPGAGASAPRVGGARGAVERNAMRYHLAIAAYLDSLAAPPAERLPRRLAAWFDATERYPAQLHEVSREEYLQMKQNETRRTGAP